MSLADDIRAAAFSREPTEIEDVICSVMFTDAELMLPTLPGDQYRTFMLICAEAFDDREARDRLEAARANAAREASQWAMEARTQRATVLDILRYFGLPENDWEALRLIQQAGINGVDASEKGLPNAGAAPLEKPPEFYQAQADAEVEGDPRVIQFMAILHANVPEEKRPKARSDFSDEQWDRACAAFAFAARSSVPASELVEEAMGLADAYSRLTTRMELEDTSTDRRARCERNMYEVRSALESFLTKHLSATDGVQGEKR